MDKLNLIPAIKQIQDIIDKKTQEYFTDIAPYEDSLKQLRKINQACERCNGKGKILRSRSCAEDDRPDPNDPNDYITCPMCAGSGEAKYVV